MMVNENVFTFSNNWWIENSKAWFVNGMYNILFCIDLGTNKCELAVRVPDTNPNTFRLTPFCIKCGKDVFCIPGFGTSIWVYDLECQKFSQIDIDNPNKIQLSFNLYYWESKIFAVPLGAFGKILEINIEQKKVENYYTICDKSNIASSTMVGSVVYSLSIESNKIYQFELSNKTLQVYTLPEVGKKLGTICFDGEKFWLSGYGREIYVWDKDNNTLITINELPQDFGIYNFDENTEEILDCKTEVYDICAFGYSAVAGEYIWFIPFQTNKVIYIDKISYRVYTFEVEEESETKESLLRKACIGIKYILVYVKDNRYIGLFSSKNNAILEIDAKELNYQWHNYDFSDKCSKLFSESSLKVLHDNLASDRVVYSMLIRTVNCNIHNRESGIGGEIYKKIMTEVSG